jgi:hypothetical protein
MIDLTLFHEKFIHVIIMELMKLLHDNYFFLILIAVLFSAMVHYIS